MNNTGKLFDSLKLSDSRPVHQSSHCCLLKGDDVGPYQIKNHLGKGRSANVWAAESVGSENVAIKVYRAGSEQLDYYANEVKILNRILERSAEDGYPASIMGYHGTFVHIEFGKDRLPRLHPCIVFDRGEESLDDVIRFCKNEFDTGLPILAAKKVARDILLGLAFLHNCNIIHTDIKPENILLNQHISDLDASTISAKIIDLGSSTFVDDIFTIEVGTTQYIAPEVVARIGIEPSADIWSAFAVCYELVTGDVLFDVFSDCDISYGIDVDGEALCTTDSDSFRSAMESDNSGYDGGSEESDLSDDNDEETIEDSEETIEDSDVSVEGYYNSSDSSGDEEEDAEYERVNYRHVLLMCKVIGFMPKGYVEPMKDHLDKKGRPKDHPTIVPIQIYDLLMMNYVMSAEECASFEKFLLIGLSYTPSARATAIQALNHQWLILGKK